MSVYINRSKWPRKLLVEGNDDLHVVTNIRAYYKLPDTFEVIDCKGVDNIADKLLSLIKNRQSVIGVVVDADANTENADDALKARWDSLRDVLVAHDYSVPESPVPEGTIIPSVDRKPKVGI